MTYTQVEPHLHNCLHYDEHFRPPRRQHPRSVRPSSMRHRQLDLPRTWLTMPCVRRPSALRRLHRLFVPPRPRRNFHVRPLFSPLQRISSPSRPNTCTRYRRIRRFSLCISHLPNALPIHPRGNHSPPNLPRLHIHRPNIHPPYPTHPHARPILPDPWRTNHANRPRPGRDD